MTIRLYWCQIWWGSGKNDGDPRTSLGASSHLTPPIFGTGEARNFKFGTRIDPDKSHLTDDKMSQKGRGQGPGTDF